MSLAWLKANVLVGSVSKLVAASLFVATFGITGCGDDPVKAGVAKGCTLNSDCKGGLVCSFGLCHQECQDSGDCPSGQRCLKTGEANVCQLDEEAKCHFRSDCEDPLVCAIDLQCRNQCKADKDCLGNQKCADNTCAEPKEVNEEGGLINAVGFGGEGGVGNEPGGGGKGGTSGGGNVDAGGDGGTPPVECVPGADCVPEGKPCVVGTTSCAGNVATCEVVSDADDGTECGTDRVCSAGECVACAAGETCDLEDNDGCLKGELSCATGPSCEVAGDVKNGTGCGTDKVCDAGACVTCIAGDACEPPGEPCKNGIVACAAGPVCTPTSNKTAGDECDTDKVCDSAAQCVSCVEGASCEPADECHQGIQECTNGPNCVDQALPVEDGTSCTSSGATYNFCSAGVCAACQQGGACVPPGDICHKGTLNCSTNPPTCNPTVNNATDGTACGDNKSCIGGSCLTNNRTLSITSGAIAAVPIDAPFAAVTVLLVDDTNTPVPSTAISVVASAGAYAQAGNTNVQGRSTVVGRVGRALGKHKFTVSAPGATSIEFEVNAVAPADDHIFTLVNANHLSAVPTTPVAGTLSKLYYQARAVTAAKDGTLYLADYATVYKLSPQGVLTRIVGDASGTLGDTGDNGPGVSARIGQVSALSLDETNGYLYIADTYYHRIRLFDLASSKIYGFAGGSTNENVSPWGDGLPPDGAYLNPTGLGLAPNGDLYISDYNAAGRIRYVDSAGSKIDTFMAPGSCTTGSPLTFMQCSAYPDGCSFAWDAAGRLFISGFFCGDGEASTFRGIARVNADKSLTRIAGAYGSAGMAEGGTATSAIFDHVPAIAFDKAGNLFLATNGGTNSTTGSNLIRRIDTLTGQITTVAGTGNIAYAGEYVPGTSAGIDSATTLAFDNANNLYFADFGNFAIRGLWNVGDTVAPTGKLAITGGNNQTVKRDALFGSLSVKVTDASNANVPGVPVTWKRKELGSGLSSTGAPSVVQFTSASGVSSMSGRVGLASGDYTFEASFTDIHGVNVSGSPQTFTTTAEDPTAGTIFPVVSVSHTNKLGSGSGPATFATLYGGAYAVAVASDGTFYVSENCAVYKVSPRGELSVFAGSPGSCGNSGDSGPAVGAQLYYPRALALDEANGVLYIAEYGSPSYHVRAVSLTTSPPKISTYAGGAADNGTNHGDGGPATAANLGAIYSVSVGPDGKVYVADPGRGIRVIDALGVISTWLPQVYSTGCVLNTPALWYTDSVASVRFNSSGDAYVSGRICEGSTTSSTNGILLIPAGGGAPTRVAGLSTGALTDGILATAAQMPTINDIAIDAAGNIYVALANTTNGNRIRRIDASTKQITTIAGDGTAGYAVGANPADYVASTTVRLSDPAKLAFWPGGHLLIADETNYAVRMIW